MLGALQTISPLTWYYLQMVSVGIDNQRIAEIEFCIQGQLSDLRDQLQVNRLTCRDRV